MMNQEWLLWAAAALAALMAGRWISVLCPALIAYFSRQWSCVDYPETNPLIRYPSVCAALLKNWKQSPGLIPFWKDRRKHLGWEVASLIATMVVVFEFGFTASGMTMAAITWMLMAMINTDFSDYLLLDCMVYPLLWAGLLWRAAGHGDAVDGIYGAFFGYAALWLVAEGYGTLRGMKMMGNGDYKLSAALGAWLGWEQLPGLFLTACIGALVLAFLLTKIRRTNLSNPLPFGPALASSGWLWLLHHFPF